MPLTASDSVVQPHPSRLQPVQLQEPTNAARATTQLTLSAEVLATLTNSISAAVSEALLNVAQLRQSAAAAAAAAATTFSVIVAAFTRYCFPTHKLYFKTSTTGEKGNRSESM